MQYSRHLRCVAALSFRGRKFAVHSWSVLSPPNASRICRTTVATEAEVASMCKYSCFLSLNCGTNFPHLPLHPVIRTNVTLMTADSRFLRPEEAVPDEFKRSGYERRNPVTGPFDRTKVGKGSTVKPRLSDHRLSDVFA